MNNTIFLSFLIAMFGLLVIPLALICPTMLSLGLSIFVFFSLLTIVLIIMAIRNE